MKYILINILSFTTIISSVLVITSQNPVISVVYLISVFVNAAGYLILSGIGFLDIIDTGKQYTKNLPLAFVVASLFIYEMFNILPFSFNNVSDTTFISFSQIEAIGQLIYTYAAILLIICSIILLLSMIAPIFISLNKK
ncbi:NADH dehydrogenase subunit 6 [Lactarius sanguifluus]|nr:NADH dehydrogenase subunit 6 [Lactarius sanguifluus]